MAECLSDLLDFQVTRTRVSVQHIAPPPSVQLSAIQLYHTSVDLP